MKFKNFKKISFSVIFLLILIHITEVKYLLSRNERNYSKIQFYLKASSSSSFSKAGDFAKLIESNDIFYTEKNGYNADLSKSLVFQGFGGEVGIEIDRYSVGLEIGYQTKTYETSIKTIATNSDYSLMRDSTLGVLPVFINIHYTFIDNPVFKIKTVFGFGMYYANYKETIKERDDSSLSAQRDGQLNARTNFPGAKFGLALQINIMKNFAFTAEGIYQIASFRDFSGQIRYKDDYHLFDEFYEGSLIYYVHKDTDQGQFAVEGDLDEQWAGENMKSDMTGFALNFGIKFSF